jgi:hypothetical protein
MVQILCAFAPLCLAYVFSQHRDRFSLCLRVGDCKDAQIVRLYARLLPPRFRNKCTFSWENLPVNGNRCILTRRRLRARYAKCLRERERERESNKITDMCKESGLKKHNVCFRLFLRCLSTGRLRAVIPVISVITVLFSFLAAVFRFSTFDYLAKVGQR